MYLYLNTFYNKYLYFKFICSTQWITNNAEQSCRLKYQRRICSFVDFHFFPNFNRTVLEKLYFVVFLDFQNSLWIKLFCFSEKCFQYIHTHYTSPLNILIKGCVTEVTYDQKTTHKSGIGVSKLLGLKFPAYCCLRELFDVQVIVLAYIFRKCRLLGPPLFFLIDFLNVKILVVAQSGFRKIAKNARYLDC